MNITELKARLFDAEQALTFAREAVEEKDTEALATALRSAKTEIETALDALGANAQPSTLNA